MKPGGGIGGNPERRKTRVERIERLRGFEQQEQSNKKRENPTTEKETSTAASNQDASMDLYDCIPMGKPISYKEEE